MQPASPLEEPLIVRPTSETIIGATFSKWVESYRDLPLLINQWANVVRWEMRTRLFLRTAEFLWQEGHTAHATREKALEETMRMLQVYADFAENYMAMPVLTGEKTAGERFPGAENTFCIEAMMQDCKALQAGTSHFLGQKFAKASDIKFQNQDGQEVFAWTTSWGVSTRLVGGLIMTHSDDDGLILPPRLAPAHVVIMPVIHKDTDSTEVMDYCNRLAAELRDQIYDKREVRVELDARDIRGGEKGWEWIKKGVPIRVEVGPRDIANDTLFVGKRTLPHRDRTNIPRTEFIATIAEQLDEIQNTLLARAKAFRDEHTVRLETREEFYDFFTPKSKKKPEAHGGFAFCHWSGEEEVEDIIKKDLNVTIRCIPLNQEPEEGTCIISGKPSKGRVYFAKSY